MNNMIMSIKTWNTPVTSRWNRSSLLHLPHPTNPYTYCKAVCSCSQYTGSNFIYWKCITCFATFAPHNTHKIHLEICCEDNICELPCHRNPLQRKLYESLYCHYNASIISIKSKIEVVVGLLTKYCVEISVESFLP